MPCKKSFGLHPTAGYLRPNRGGDVLARRKGAAQLVKGPLMLRKQHCRSRVNMHISEHPLATSDLFLPPKSSYGMVKCLLKEI
jgi:hypothetical protein